MIIRVPGWFIKSAVLIFILIYFLGCASAPFPDEPACLELSPTVGYCIYTVSNTEFYVDDAHLYQNKNWAALKATSVIIPSTSWPAIKSYIQSECLKDGGCDEEFDHLYQKLK